MKLSHHFSFHLAIAVIAACTFALPAAAASKRAAKCSQVLTPLTEAQRLDILNKALETGILFGHIQTEAVVRVAAEEKLLPGMKIEVSSKKLMQVRKPLKELSKFLGATAEVDAKNRRAFAEKVVAYIEKVILPKNLANHPIERKAQLKKIVDNFYDHAEIGIRDEKMNQAWILFHEILSTPGGREFLTDAFINSNASAAYIAYKGQSGVHSSIGWIGSILLAGPATAFITGDAYFMSHLGGATFFGAMAAVLPSSLIMAAQPLGPIRRSLTKAIEGRRLKKLLAANSDSTTEIKVPDIEEATEPELNAVFDRELVKAEAQGVEKIKVDIGSGDFNAVATFGVELISRVDQAVDLIALMSKRMELLEKDVKALSASISDGKLTVSLNEVIPVIERSFQTSSDVLQDGEQLEVYLRLLQGKIADHVTMGQSALENDKLTSSNAKAEMEDVLEELRNAQLTIEPSTKILPMMNQVAQGQRSAIRELRTSLRGHKLSQSEQISKLIETVAKLQSVKISN